MIGVLISMQEPNSPRKTEADLLAGKHVEMPPIRQVGATFKKAPKVSKPQAEQPELT